MVGGKAEAGSSGRDEEASSGDQPAESIPKMTGFRGLIDIAVGDERIVAGNLHHRSCIFTRGCYARRGLMSHANKIAPLVKVGPNTHSPHPHVGVAGDRIVVNADGVNSQILDAEIISSANQAIQSLIPVGPMETEKAFPLSFQSHKGGRISSSLMR